MLPLGILYRKCFQGENSRSPAKISDGLFQVIAPFSRHPPNRGRSQDMQRLSVLKGKSLECAYIQCRVATENGLFQVVPPLPFDAQLVCLCEPMVSQGIFVRESCQSEDRQSGTKTANGPLKVVALRSQDTLSIDIAQRTLYARILVWGMCQRIDLQGCFASHKSGFHLLSAITIETLLV